ncbi:hypothetical protein F5Y16DRAFT_132456 [Xylariaceae sp. FL0255]|nr:hypothetical protein F5Y16DRAFT_132456 [Xylariaceae sp. FL0255]
MSKVKQAPKIAIIGAGPGGLMLASILHHNNIPSIIFERETSAVAREQGGTLDIHAEAGQRALHAAGLLDNFRKAIRQGGDSMRLLKKDGTVLIDVSDDGPPQQGAGDGDGEEINFIPGRPEIDRPVLKDILVASLPPETIRWGSKVVSIDSVPGTQQWALTIKTDDNNEVNETFDLVVGADGAWSRVRRLLTDTKPFYSGVTALDVCIEDVDNAAPDVAAFIGLGNCFIFSAERALLFQRNGAGRARCYACVRIGDGLPPSGRELLGLSDAESEDEVDWTNLRNRETFVERNFSDYFPEAKRAVLAMGHAIVLRPLYMLPIGLTWKSQPGVTVLGDAAHLMTPFAGVGVNVALVDALELAEGVIDFVGTGAGRPDKLADMLAKFEKGMFERSSVDAAQTQENMEFQFRDDGGEKMVEMMMQHGPPQ